MPWYEDAHGEGRFGRCVARAATSTIKQTLQRWSRLLETLLNQLKITNRPSPCEGWWWVTRLGCLRKACAERLGMCFQDQDFPQNGSHRQLSFVSASLSHSSISLSARLLLVPQSDWRSRRRVVRPHVALRTAPFVQPRETPETGPVKITIPQKGFSFWGT